MDQRLINEAVNWFVRMQDGPPSAATKTQFTEWLLLSPEHIRAFLDVTQSMSSLGDATRDFNKDKLLERAAQDRASNVISLEWRANVTPDKSLRDQPSRIKSWVVAGIVCGSIVAGALGGWFACVHWHHAAPTPTEQRS
jgi:hypothetical protein